MPTSPSPLPETRSELHPHGESSWLVTAPEGETVRLTLPQGTVVLLDGDDELFVLPSDTRTTTLVGSGSCWFLPESADSGNAWLVETDAAIQAEHTEEGWTVKAESSQALLVRHLARPHADVQGNRFRLDLPGGQALADALAGFYWGTMLPSVIERTTAQDYPDSSGFVVSTLADKYQGTYPDVDHEFQIKGRLAWGSRLDQDVARRMIELQLRLMREDPAQLWRNPCAVQPDGTREYHVRRNSMDGSENAVMFLVTGNIEVLESIWLLIARSKDLDWLRAHITEIEGAASGIQEYIDPHGRLWGDVYYEDQVIKDGRETMAQALAIRSFGLLAELEELLGREVEARRYRQLRDRLASSLAEPLPYGWWDPEAQRFVDWVDRSGRVHDHIHLLANILPVLVGAAAPKQERAVDALIEAELPEFQRFPTFLSARIADYGDDEIGDGGPYDLCAAGRYWCWDAAFWSSRGDGAMLRRQLDTVAEQGASEGFVMGERYDMGHVYYRDDSPWHGAAHYYEYPCVYSWVLFCEYLGLRASLDAELLIAPRLESHGEVRLEQEAYRIQLSFTAAGLTVTNLADRERLLRIDAGALFPEASAFVTSDGQRHDGSPLRVPAGDSITVSPVLAA